MLFDALASLSDALYKAFSFQYDGILMLSLHVHKYKAFSIQFVSTRACSCCFWMHRKHSLNPSAAFRLQGRQRSASTDTANEALAKASCLLLAMALQGY